MIRLVSILAALGLAGFAVGGVHPVAARAWPLALAAEHVRDIPAPDADQGAAVDDSHVYAVDNFVIAKHDKATGVLLARWDGGADGPLAHMNACRHEADELWCANSNYPEIPMASSIEVFDAATLEHRRSISLGINDEGSLTWIDRIEGGWIAGFAHYGTDRGLPFKDQRYGSVIRFDEAFRRTGGWMFPTSVMEQFGRYSASGGAIGPDGLLYVAGHDTAEIYVLAAPIMGPKLVHVATIAAPIEGQAFDWDESAAPDRIVWAVERRGGQLRELRLPDAGPLPAGAVRFPRP